MGNGNTPIGKSKAPVAAASAPAPSPAQLCSQLASLAQLDHYRLFVDNTCKLLLAQRTTVPFDRAAAIVECFRQIEQLLADLDRARFALLVDTRNGPSRNDVTFESVVAEHRGKLLFGFARNAALAITAAGRLQIQRYAKADGRVVFATDSPVAAFEYLGVPPHKI